MGSQNVTDFDAVRKKSIRAEIQRYVSADPKEKQPFAAGAIALDKITKTSNFVQAISSPSVRNALELLVSLARELKRSDDPAQVLRKRGFVADSNQPLGMLIAEITKSLSERLNVKQQETDPAFAAKDAITRTVIEVLSKEIAPERVDAPSAQEISRSFRKAGLDGLSTIFFENVITSLISMTLDAARGSTPRAVVREIVEANRPLISELTREIVKLDPTKPKQIISKIPKAKVAEKLEKKKLIMK